MSVVRRMSAVDVERVIALAASLKDAPHWRREAYLRALDPGATPVRIAFVAENPKEGAVAGFAVACVMRPQAELESIAVRAADQRQGTGRKLFFAVVEELGAQGVRSVFLEVRASNQRARDFYRSLGWKETGLRPRYYAEPEEDAVLMGLELE